jgi:aryl-alcohol dehydrogenase-like predicted oxidoreductase
MQKRKLGNSGLEVAPLALGGNVFGWTADEAASFRVLDAFVDAGFNLIDTADVYSSWVPGNRGGESETMLGKWIKRSGKRNKVLIATKCGMEMNGQKGLSRAYIPQALEASLARLQTDYVDLYQSHKDDPDTPLAEMLEAFDGLMKAGKVRAIGCSNYSGERLAESLEVSRRHGLARFESLQPHYNLAARTEYETKLEPVCEWEKLGVIPYYSLAAGFLTGKYRSEDDLSKSARGKSAAKRYFNERGLKILQALDSVAAQYHVRPVHVALAWLAARSSITAPIASATSVEQLQDLIAGVQLQLDSSSIELLNRASG